MVVYDSPRNLAILMTDFYKDKAVAQSYHKDRLGTNLRRYKDWLEKKFLLENLNIFGKAQVLDIGCGTGRIAELFLKRGFPVMALDNSEEMIEEFEERMKLIANVNLKTRVASVEKLPFGTNSYFSVTAFRLLWHLNEKQLRNTLKEIARVSSKIVAFDITNDEYRNRLVGKINLFLYKKLFKKKSAKSYYLNKKKIIAEFQKMGFELYRECNLESLSHFWLNLLPTSNVKLFFRLAKVIDNLLLPLFPAQRIILLFKRFD